MDQLGREVGWATLENCAISILFLWVFFSAPYFNSWALIGNLPRPGLLAAAAKY